MWLMNPRSYKQKVAVGKISDLPGKHSFHFKAIRETWFKVDVITVLQPAVALMYPNDDDDQTIIDHVKGTCTLWDQKYLKSTV